VARLRYADMHPELLALMQRFELCYELPDARTWLSPQMLPPSRPANLDDWGGRATWRCNTVMNSCPRA